jgi:hypothetical protein
MEHGIGSGSPHLVQVRSAEGVMVRRLSVASLDSGAESPVYGEEPSASAGRGDPAAGPLWADGGLIVSGEPAWLPAPPAAWLPGAQQVSSDRAAQTALASQLPGRITSLQVPRGGETGDITVTVDWTLHGQVGTEAPRLATNYDMSVVDRQSGRWYVKDIRAATQPMGTQ